MAWKGGGKPNKGHDQARSKGGSWNGRIATKERELISQKYFEGSVHEWGGTWGWVVPSEKIPHPKGDRLYLHKTDVRNGSEMFVGLNVQFQVYSDYRGAGCCDCHEVQQGGMQANTNDQEEALPEGWEMHWSPEHNDYFYWHRLTKEASWDRPGPDEEETLPEGWEKHLDTERNQVYYWHKPSRTASWERPQGPEETAQENAPPQEPHEQASKRKVDPEGRGNTDGPVLGLQRVTGRIAQWKGFFGWITPLQELGEDLKPLLEANKNLIYVSWRDMQEGLSTQPGQKVEFQIYTDDNGVAAADVRELKAGPAKAAGKKTNLAQARRAPGQGGAKVDSVLKELEQQWEEQDAQLFPDGPDGYTVAAAADEPLDKASADGDEADLTEGPLLPGWEQLWSDENKCYYYWHASSKQSCWERPAVAVAAGTGGRAIGAGTGQAQGQESFDEGAAHSATPMTPLISQTGREMTPITPTLSKGKGKGFGNSSAMGRSEQSTGFLAAQASGIFRGRGWQGGVSNEAAAAAANEEHGALTYQSVQKSGGRGGSQSWRPSTMQRPVPSQALPPVKRPRMA